ncbi:hypothetical protein [Anabaena azotica]|uniref:hypothetical protein n=1 Tax=Anabaena azotica TaxID=197653 RepID=UPI0039A75BC9
MPKLVRILLDRQCFLWWFAEPERLNEEAMPSASAAIAHIADEGNELWLSVASVWEMGIKVLVWEVRLQ